MADKQETSVRDIFDEINNDLGDEALSLTREILGSFSSYGIGGTAKDINSEDRPNARVVSDLALKAKTGKLKYELQNEAFVYNDKTGQKHLLTANDPLFNLICDAAQAAHAKLPNNFSEDKKMRAREIPEMKLGSVLADILNGVSDYF